MGDPAFASHSDPFQVEPFSESPENLSQDEGPQGPAPDAPVAGLHALPGTGSATAGLALAKRLDAVRDAIFPADRLGDPVWRVLLELGVARAEGRRASGATLAIATGISARTTLRCIDVLVHEGLASRIAGDRVPQFELTRHGAAQMDRYAEAVIAALG